MIILFILGAGEVSDAGTREEAFETYEAKTWEELARQRREEMQKWEEESNSQMASLETLRVLINLN